MAKERKIATALTSLAAVALIMYGDAKESMTVVVIGMVVAVSDVVIYCVIDLMAVKTDRKRGEP